MRLRPVAPFAVLLLILGGCSSDESDGDPETLDDDSEITSGNVPEPDAPPDREPTAEPGIDLPILDIEWRLTAYRTSGGDDVTLAYATSPYRLRLASDGSVPSPFRVSLDCGAAYGDYRLDGSELTTIDVSDASEAFGCDGEQLGDPRTDAFVLDLFVGTRSLSADVSDGVLMLASASGAQARFRPHDGDAVAARTLAEGVDGGPILTDDPDAEAGLHLRRFVAYTDADEAREALDAIDWRDGADRSDLADVLDTEGGTLLGLYLGLQPVQGPIGTSVNDVAAEEDRLVVALRTTTADGCDADDASGAPFRIVHVGARAPRVVFREAIVPCEDGAGPVDEVSSIDVEFTGDSSAVITWAAPPSAGESVSYDVIRQDGEQGADVYDGVTGRRYEVDDLVPGIVRIYRIVPVDPDSGAVPRGRVLALITDAPSALFKGRVSREDFETHAGSLAGPGAIDCGDRVVSFAGEPEAAPTCAENALADGEAFVRTWTFIGGESPFARALAGDSEGNVWLLDWQTSDVGLSNPFVPSSSFDDGLLEGRSCPVPLIDDESGRVRCGG